jgi:glutamyl aminopeptidase
MINKIYRDLFELPGISGNEHLVRKYMRNFMGKYPNYEIIQDNLGSIFAVKRSRVEKPMTVMVAGHMDEVGLMVTEITKQGHIKVEAIGGLNGEVFISQVMYVYTKNGIVPGVIGALPPHLKQSQTTNISDLILDIGATSKEEAQSFGVELGNMVLFKNQFHYSMNKKRVIAKAIDNRYGCGLALEAIEKFHDIDLPFDLVVGATVQEEVGLRGAETSVNLFKPDVFIALDASPVNELDKDNMASLGGGFLLRMLDPRNKMHKGLMEYFVELADKNKIKYQYFVSKGGTDAAKALDMNEGILATTIGLPARYIHSTAAMMDINDLKEAKKMLFKLLLSLNSDVITKIRKTNF